MKKILISTAAVLASIFAIVLIVSATSSSNESKKAKTEFVGCAGNMASTAACCDTAVAIHPGCNPTASDPIKCDPANCDKPGCCHPEGATASAEAAVKAGCAARCGGL